MAKLRRSFICSLLLHAGLVAFVCLDWFKTTRKIPRQQNVQVTLLYKDAPTQRASSKLLPKKIQTVESKESLVPAIKPVLSKPLALAPKPKAAAKSQGLNKEILLGLQKVTQQQEDQDVKDLQESLHGDYLSHVQALIMQAYQLPRILQSDTYNHLRVLVRLRISAQGRLLEAKVVKKSQHALFDEAVLQSTRAVIDFGAPPLQLQKQISQQGFVVQFCPNECEEG